MSRASERLNIRTNHAEKYTGIYPAMVIGQDPSRYAVQVVLLSLYSPPYSVRVLMDGPCDALRASQRPLPLPGTMGLICFANGDIRSGFWLGSYPRNLIDAITTDQANTLPALQNGNVDYVSEASGYWSIRDGGGNQKIVWPDGTPLVVGSPPPTPYSHNVQVNQNQTVQQVAQTDLVPTPPPPFPLTLTTASGVSLSISTSGSVIITVPNGQTIKYSDGDTSYQLVDSRFVDFFNTHTHTSESAGTPTSEPLQQAAIGSQTTTATYAG